MALNDSCHLLIETKRHFIQKSGGGGLEQNMGRGLSPIASAATGTGAKYDLQTEWLMYGILYQVMSLMLIL